MKALAVIGLLALLAVASASVFKEEEYQMLFTKWMTQYNKKYTEQDFFYRYTVFKGNLDKIYLGNSQKHTYTMGMNAFGDMTHAEFKQAKLGFKNVVRPWARSKNTDGPHLNITAVPTSVDWRKEGAVTPVKDQGQCGSCWAFSATAAIESYNFLAGKGLLVLSPQQIVSCDTRDGACNGGNTETAYQYVQSAGGQELEATYPYTSGNGVRGACRFDATKIAARITGYRSVARSETALASALNQGPVSVCLAADAFQHYTGGILTSCPGRIDHCVQAVGYGVDNWIVRNSWGTRWGEGGYIRIKRGANLCQIANDVTYPTI